MKSVLFVDDMRYIHTYEKRLSKKLGVKGKHALSPEQARHIIAFRIKAARRLLAAKRAAFAKEKSQPAKRKLRRQIASLQQALQIPFDLIVSDLNMPKGDPTGMRFARQIRKTFPKQDILIFSDDPENMKVLREEMGLSSAFKEDPERENLEEGMRKILRAKKAKAQ